MKKVLSMLLTLALIAATVPAAMAAEAAPAFPDIAGQSDAVKASIEKMKNDKIFEGYTDGTFKPEKTITRAEFAITMARLADLEVDKDAKPSFTDVSGFAAPYIAAVEKAGIMQGTGGGKFTPNAQINIQSVSTALLRWAGMKDSQFSTWPADYNAMAVNSGLGDDIDYVGTDAATRAETASLIDNCGALYEALHSETPELYFHNGEAQPIFEYDTMVREVVYVETSVDSDNDGKKDLVQVLVQRPQATEKGMKAAAIYEARPYSAGVTDAYDYDVYNGHIVNAELNGKNAEAPASAAITVGETGESLTPAEGIWETTENLDNYDYWLVRGYAYVSCSGLGTSGSEGIQTCGAEEEVKGYSAVIDWLNGRTAGYTDRTRTEKVTADWCTGNVAMSGQSYGGTTSFGVAATGIDGLKTIVPRAGICNWYDYYRSQGTPAGGLYYPGDDCDILADYCMSRLNDIPEDSELAVTYKNYLQQMIVDEDRASGDYNAFWDERNYAKHADLKCSALIVHGLNDFNVRTKQFADMLDAFEADGCTAKLVLHQGAHMTPTQLEGLDYNKLLNRWYAFYLYGVDNGVDKDPAVRVQSNIDQSWSTYDSWDSASKTVTLKAGSGTSTFTSDLSKAGFDTSNADVDEGWIEYCSDMSYNWEKNVISGTTEASAVYTFDVTEDMHILGTPSVTVKASADSSNGILSAMIVDIAEYGMEAQMLTPYTEAVDTVTINEKSIWQGGGLAALDSLGFVKTNVTEKIITRGWMDICNRTSIEKMDKVTPGQYYTYKINLQPMDYTVKAGHKLALVIYSVDPEVTYWPEAVTNFTVDNSGTSVAIPVK